MADLATVRTEIKTWERRFKASNGYAPQIDDVVAHSMEAKYKLYKKLSKAAALAESSRPPQPEAIPATVTVPSTPPRRKQPKASTSILHSTPRNVEPSEPLAGFNPFSPKKKSKGKGKDRDFHSPSDGPRTSPNPKSQPRLPTRGRSLSPELPSSNLQVNATSENDDLPIAASPEIALSRARKRLRGEVVSPSPNKDKRRRVSSQSMLSFPRLILEPQPEKQQPTSPDGESSYVDNSPVKAPKIGKSFPALFDQDAIPVDLFGVKSSTMPSVNNFKALASGNTETSPGKTRRQASIRTAIPTHNKMGRVSEVNTELGGRTMVGASPSLDNDAGIQSETSSNRSSLKRSLSEVADNDVTPGTPRGKSPLLPPSPPPEKSSVNSRTSKNKTHLKGNVKGRKKSKVDSERMDEDDSDEQELQAKLRVVNRHDTRAYITHLRHDEDGFTSDSDLNLAHPRFKAPRAPTPDNLQLNDGDVEIDLPEQLRNVLALHSATNNQVSDEERLVKGLLYGRRVTHYDPNKGGEIWGIGENDDRDLDDRHPRNVEEEDDWEGEPVPWEAGEL